MGMEYDWSHDVEMLQHLLANCIQAWKVGFDCVGSQYFLQGLQQLELMVGRYTELLTNHVDTISPMLHKLNQRLMSRDIIGVQDCVEYEWYPMVVEWANG
jgi:hypothetical protein